MTNNTSRSKTFLYIRRFICYFILIILTILSLFSFYILFINSTRSHPDIMKGFSALPGKVFFTNLKNVLSNENLPVLRGIANSFIVAGSCAVISTYFSALTAYGIHAYEFNLKNTVFSFILMIMMVPTQVSALGFVNMVFSMGLKNSFIPLVVPTIAAPVTFFYFKQYMESALPLEIVEAARIDGSGELNTFNKIIFPMIKPAIAVQAIFAFVNNWNNYFLPALIIDDKNKKTLPILIAQLRSADWLKFDLGQVYMLIAIAILPIIVVYLILSKYIVRGVALGSIKG